MLASMIRQFVKMVHILTQTFVSADLIARSVQQIQIILQNGILIMILHLASVHRFLKQFALAQNTSALKYVHVLRAVLLENS